MPDLYGVVSASGTITRFYVAPDGGAAGSNQKLITGTTEDPISNDKANEYILRKTVNGASGYKYKWASPDIVAKTDTEIKASLEWKENKRYQLTTKAALDIRNLGEEEVHSLMGRELLERKNSGPAITQPEIDKIQEFEDSRQAILDGVNSNAESDEFSKAKKDTIDTNAPDIDVKSPSVFAVDDEITIIDSGVNPKTEVAIIASISSDTIAFDDALTNTTKYKQNTTWIYKTG